MTLEKKLNELIGEGINITKQAQEDGASYSTDPDNYLDNAYKIFNDWRQEIKDFIYNEKIGSDINVFFFKEDSVNRFLGLAEYLDPENKNKQRELLKSIRIETSIKLEKLIELKKEQLEKISKKPERVESSFWVTKDKDKYSYNDKLLRIKNQTTDYFIIFDVAYHLAEKGGNIKYDKIKECCKKRKLSTTRKKIQRALTGESATFFKYIEEIPRILSGGICLFEASPDGKFLTFNNKKN